jgi:hypothetical protein
MNAKKPASMSLQNFKCQLTELNRCFGPNPDSTWRDELADLLIETMKPEFT